MDQAFPKLMLWLKGIAIMDSVQVNLPPSSASGEGILTGSVRVQDLSAQLATITGFDAVSLQPNSGASGEYAGLMSIRAYHLSRGDHDRK